MNTLKTYTNTRDEEREFITHFSNKLYGLIAYYKRYLKEHYIHKENPSPSKSSEWYKTLPQEEKTTLDRNALAYADGRTEANKPQLRDKSIALWAYMLEDYKDFRRDIPYDEGLAILNAMYAYAHLDN